MHFQKLFLIMVFIVFSIGEGAKCGYPRIDDYCDEEYDDRCNDNNWPPTDKSRFESISGDIIKMMKEKSSYDVFFKFEDFYTGKAHKQILAARSPVFKAMFKGNKRKYIIDMEKDDDPAWIMAMLNWAYTGNINYGGYSFDKYALDILKLADKYQMHSLIVECEFILQKQINRENATEMLILADSLKLRHLKKAIFKFMSRNISIVKRKEFQDKISKGLFVDLIIAIIGFEDK